MEANAKVFVFDFRIFVWWPGKVTMAGIFTQTLKKVLNLFVAKSGYQKPKSGSPSKVQVAWGYWPTIKSYTGF